MKRQRNSLKFGGSHVTYVHVEYVTIVVCNSVFSFLLAFTSPSLLTSSKGTHIAALSSINIRENLSSFHSQVKYKQSWPLHRPESIADRPREKRKKRLCFPRFSAITVEFSCRFWEKFSALKWVSAGFA